MRLVLNVFNEIFNEGNTKGCENHPIHKKIEIQRR